MIQSCLDIPNMSLDVSPIRAYMTFAFMHRDNMDARTKRHIVREALNGGDETSQILAIAMIVPFVFDHSAMIADIRKYIPQDQLGYFTSLLYNELHASGSASSAKICYGEFKKEINKHVALTKKLAAKIEARKNKKAKINKA